MIYYKEETCRDEENDTSIFMAYELYFAAKNRRNFY